MLSRFGFYLLGFLAAALAGWPAAIAAQDQSAIPLEARQEFQHLKWTLANPTNKSPNQKFPIPSPQTLASEAANPAALLDPARDRDPLDVVLRRAGALLERLKAMPEAGDFKAEQDELVALKTEAGRVAPADEAARLALFTRAAALRRRVAFANPLLRGLDSILFVKRPLGKYEHMCDQFYGHTFDPDPRSGLFALERPFSDRPALKNLLAGSVCGNGRFKGLKLDKGVFLAPDLSFDGRQILFAYTEADLEGNPYNGEAGIWTPKTTFHIFKVNADGSGLTQLTDGAWNEIDPCWLPNGRIAFISERRGGYLRCSGRRPCPLYTLYTMNADGGDITQISPHESHEWQPSVDHNGMLIYTRWDYIDRGALIAHHPWITTPDGRDPRAITGNYPELGAVRPVMEMDLRAIPGSRKLVAVAAGHHSQALGSLITIDPSIPDDGKMAQIRRVTPYAYFNEAEVGPTAHQFYATPWPLSEEFYICAYSPTGRRDQYGLYLVDVFGNAEPLHRDPAIHSLSPLTFRPRPRPPVIPHVSTQGVPDGVKIAAADSTARMAVMNVYNSRLPFPKDARIKALRIVQVLAKATPIDQSPKIGYGLGTGARAVLGTVPVEADGSAYFTLPAATEVYFQALDERGLSIQSMRSGTWAHPGETLNCVGCHDPRQQAPEAKGETPLALRRAPSAITPEPDGSNPFSFPRLVQPVLEKNCVACHQRNADKKAPDLTRGDWATDGFRWFASYRNLMPYAYFHGLPSEYIWSTPRSTPGQVGARASKLFAMLEAGHHGLKLSPEDFHRITLWLDSNADFYGSYDRIDAQARGEVVRYVSE